MANRFITDEEVQRVELGDGDWVEIPSRVSYGFVAAIGKMEGDKMEATTQTLIKLIRKWNLKGSDGQVAVISKETIAQLEFTSAQKILEAAAPLLNVDPKASIG